MLVKPVKSDQFMIDLNDQGMITWNDHNPNLIKSTQFMIKPNKLKYLL